MAPVPATWFSATVDPETGIVTLLLAAEGLAMGTALTVEATVVDPAEQLVVLD